METVIFDRNHVKIRASDERVAKGGTCNVYVGYAHRSMTLEGSTITQTKSKYEKVIKESPLGFYYSSVEKVEYEEQIPITVNMKLRVTTIYDYYGKYTIEYPLECNDAKVGFDSRPYDICVGDKSIPDHVINAMKKKLDDIFESCSHIKNINRAKETTYTELFGSVNGLSSVPNEIKILSHGFDPKESFRKRKKEKK